LLDADDVIAYPEDLCILIYVSSLYQELEKDNEKRKILPRISAAFKNPLKVHTHDTCTRTTHDTHDTQTRHTTHIHTHTTHDTHVWLTRIVRHW
jgi:hypothetical protein